MNKELKKYLLGMVLPLVILFGMTVIPIATLFMGEEILLKTKPVDPRDLFRGDYVVLSYEVQDLEPMKLDQEIKANLGEENFYNKLRGKDIYVILKKEGKYQTVDYATLKKPSGKMYLKGKLSHLNQEWLPSNDKSLSEEEREKKGESKLISVSVDYSLDKYFVPENTGTELEELSRTGQLVAKVKILRGYATLVNVSAE